MPSGPLGGPRPFANGEEIWLDLTIHIKRDVGEPFDPESKRYFDIISDYIRQIRNQQPEAKTSGGVVKIEEAFSYHLGGTEHTLREPDDLSEVEWIQDRVEIQLHLDPPVLVVSHIDDAQRILDDKYPEFVPGDTRVASAEIMKQRDEMLGEHHDNVYSAGTFL